ncbi:tripartite tricarboxylate transporter TctB family protein [Mycolicibacterium wolinskyi]|uniref:tripartite tricarboxylate transporter TctB family protein n=1 Tax=Mycolicibacterium TaxID=1866885 RepID=UPI000A151A7F|nr:MULTISPECIES: tripartite tricarboxylate transporter TctB family protein [Mycolicibacterium]MCV7287355.1 tripartite tricarboxylate transporter TctB family protein [Mycolicibacterium wolinskyi]MCV7295006.1 tripartite tricarboxylate transporter TctB family protein [Mycolicibacterium goodii]
MTAVQEPHARDVLAEIEAEVAHELEDERPPAGGTAYQVIGALAGLAIGVVGTVLAYGYGLGSLAEPGPGLWPFVVSVVIALLSVLLLVVGRGLTDSEKFTRSSLLAVAGGVTFVAFGLLMPLIGFEIPAVLLCVIWLRFLGGESWRSTIVVSVVTTAVFYFLFLYGLRIPLPHLIAF